MEQGVLIMPECLICCGILRREVEQVFVKHAAGEYCDVKRIYLEPALHVDLNKLKEILSSALANVAKEGSSPKLIYGRMCHPEMEFLAGKYGAAVAPSCNCIEMLLGEDMARIDAEARTFYLTPGWLENWKEIFIKGLGWDSVDARQNFGGYERILLLDTGVMPLEEERILEFFDYTQVPVEIRQVGLDNLFRVLKNLLFDKGGKTFVD